MADFGQVGVNRLMAITATEGESPSLVLCPGEVVRSWPASLDASTPAKTIFVLYKDGG